MILSWVVLTSQGCSQSSSIWKGLYEMVTRRLCLSIWKGLYEMMTRRLCLRHVSQWDAYMNFVTLVFILQIFYLYQCKFPQTSKHLFPKASLGKGSGLHQYLYLPILKSASCFFPSFSPDSHCYFLSSLVSVHPNFLLKLDSAYGILGPEVVRYLERNF